MRAILLKTVNPGVIKDRPKPKPSQATNGLPVQWDVRKTSPVAPPIDTRQGDCAAGWAFAAIAAFNSRVAADKTYQGPNFSVQQVRSGWAGFFFAGKGGHHGSTNRLLGKGGVAQFKELIA